MIPRRARLSNGGVDIRAYAKYVLKEGSVSEKRDLLGNLRSKISYANKSISILK